MWHVDDRATLTKELDYHREDEDHFCPYTAGYSPIAKMSAPLMKHFHGIFASRNVANNATHLIPHIRPNSRILDVGCSIGSITLDLAQRVPQGEVVAIDISEGQSKLPITL